MDRGGDSCLENGVWISSCHPKNVAHMISVIVSFRLIYLKAEFHLGSASHDDEAREATVSDSQDHPRRSPQCEMH